MVQSILINLTSQIALYGTNIAFAFCENQIQKLISKSPCDERRLDVLRASCIDQPHEMVNLFIAPMRNMSSAQRVEKALDRLRQRFGPTASGGRLGMRRSVCKSFKIPVDGDCLWVRV